ncbi:cytochrome P450 [Kineococcus arenarius]|uniref:cytochrome P450 n=1 Tax=Kineococcus sp. SYSU DK020 TaxID=3383141 RepID=UPI003D7E5CEA
MSPAAPRRAGAARRNARYTPLETDGPLPWEMVRSVPAIRRAPHEFLAGLVRRYGDTAAVPLPRTPVLVLNDPAGVRRVLVDNARGYGKATVQYTALAAVTGPGLLAGDGPTWRSHRRTLQPAFHHGSLDAVAEHAVGAARTLRAEVDALPPGRALDVVGAVSRASLEVVGRTLAAADLSGVAPRLVDAVGEALELVVARAASPVPASWPTRSRRALAAAVAEIDEVCARVLAERRARGVAPDATDVVALMLNAGMGPQEVRDELVTFVVAGHETVASSLTWTLDLLAREPSAQRRLQAELAAVLGPPGAAREPRWEDLPRLRYARAVVDESLRLYPPAWVITRRALADDVLAGVPVPAGTLVIVSTWALHRHPGAWPAPEQFRPERFLDAPRRDAYAPFGAGPRQCIGRDLALVEEVFVLAALLRDRAVRPVPGRRAQVEALVSLRPRGGLELFVEPRR